MCRASISIRLSGRTCGQTNLANGTRIKSHKLTNRRWIWITYVDKCTCRCRQVNVSEISNWTFTHNAPRNLCFYKLAILPAPSLNRHYKHLLLNWNVQRVYFVLLRVAQILCAPPLFPTHTTTAWWLAAAASCLCITMCLRFGYPHMLNFNTVRRV